MEKKELKSKIDETINLIKTNSKDARFAEDLIDKLMSLKGQYDVEPMYVGIPMTDVEKEVDFGGFELVKCKGCIIYHIYGGVKKIVTPRMTCLYKHLENLLFLKEALPTSSDIVRENYEAVLLATTQISNLETYASVDDEFMLGIYNDIVSRLEVLYKKLNTEELQPETPELNAAFENKLKIAEEVFKGGQE